MKLSCASLFLWEYTVYDIVEILLDAGIKRVELWAETPDFWKNRNDAITLAALEETISIMPEGCTLHAPVLDLNPASINDNVHEVTIRETLWSLDLAKNIGARAVTIHPGRRTVHRAPTNEDWGKFLEYLKVCKEKADRLNLCLSLENSMPGVQTMCSTPDEMKSVLTKFPGLFFTFDVVHAFIQSPQIAMSFINELSDKMINVHVGSPHNGKPHYPSHRKKKMGAILRALKDSGYEGDLTIEIDDQRYSRPLSREDKVIELREEREYLEEIFDQDREK
ncbi:MAG: sugar phosphate isomerase/epimerase [Candidatus Methanoperedens sp.]|nr:sugar phosphate isomerase/epimerase [Candidatus Methanoperedens sp.]